MTDNPVHPVGVPLPSPTPTPPLTIDSSDALPSGEPLPDTSPCEAIIQRMICDLEIEYCCLIEPSGDLIVDALNTAHLQTVTAQLSILQEALAAIKVVYP